MGPLRAGLVYFFLVFGAGFVLGVVRTLFVTPWVGASRAELLETPLMLLVVWRAARWLQPRLRPGAALPAGLLALAILLGAETGVGVFLRQMPHVRWMPPAHNGSRRLGSGARVLAGCGRKRT